MPWVRIDDGFLTNPKIMSAGLEGRAVYIAGLCFCAAGLTDGYVPAEALGKLAMLADVRRPGQAVTRLVEVGLWESVQGGYQVHDYLKYQPSAADVRKERDRVAGWRAKKRNANGVRNGVPNGVQNTVQHGVRNAVENGSGTASRANGAPARPGPDQLPVGPLSATSPARARPPDVAPPRGSPSETTTDETAEPERLPNGATQCPTCPQIFTGTYADHLATASTHKIRDEPEDFQPRRRHRRGEVGEPVPPEIEAELDEMRRAKAERGPLQLSDDLAAEDARLRARERSQREGNQGA